jgi:hypothetical protein
VSDRNVTVRVSIEGENNVGPAAKEAAQTVEKALSEATKGATAGIPRPTRSDGVVSDAGGDDNSSELARVRAELTAKANEFLRKRDEAVAAARLAGGGDTASAADPIQEAKAEHERWRASTDAEIARIESLQKANASNNGFVSAMRNAVTSGIQAAGGFMGGGGGQPPYNPGSTQPPGGGNSGFLSSVVWGDGGKGSVSIFRQAAEGMKQFQVAALAGAAAASAAVAATAPAAWATFTGSIQLLSGEFANMLIPAFVQASAWIQRGAAWVKSWDERTKGFVSTVAVWGGGLVIAGGAISKLGAVIMPVVQGFGMLAVAGTRAAVAVAGFAVANPWVAGIVAATAAVGYLTNGFGLLGDSISRAGARADEARERIGRLQQGGAITRSDYESLPINVRMGLEGARGRNGRTDPEQRHVTLQNMINATEGDLERLMQTNPTVLQTRIEEILGNNRRWNQGGQEALQRQRAIQQLLEGAGVPRMEASRRAIEAVGATREGALGNAPTAELIQAASRQASGFSDIAGLRSQAEVLRQVQQNGIPGLFEGLAMSRGNFQPRTFASGDQFYGDILQQVLGRGNLEQQILQQLINNDQRAIEVGNQIVGAINAVGNPAPR